MFIIQDRFVTKYNNRSIEDCGSYTSEEFNTFAKGFKSFVKRNLEDLGFTLDSFYKGHYSISGFLEKDGRYIYFGYDVPRDNYPIDVNTKSAHMGILIRSAESPRDFHGGMNNFTSFKDFADDVNSLFNRYKNIGWR